MSEAEKRRILTGILGRVFRTGAELLFRCPECAHPKNKLSVNIDKNAFKCWICDYSGRSISRLVRRFGNFKQVAGWRELDSSVDINDFGESIFGVAQAEPSEEQVSLPKEFISLANGNKSIGSLAARRYLNSRGITEKDIIRWKVGYTSEGEYANRVIIPSFGMSGYCNYFVSRTYVDDWMKYKNPPVEKDIIFNHLYVDWDESVVLVEGVYDAIVAGPGSIPILGSTLRENSKLFQEIVANETTIYIALDPDAEKKALRLINNLMEYGVKVYKINIFPFLDVGAMDKDEFSKRKKNAILMNSSNYLLRTVLHT